MGELSGRSGGTNDDRLQRKAGLPSRCSWHQSEAHHVLVSFEMKRIN